MERKPAIARTVVAAAFIAAIRGLRRERGAAMPDPDRRVVGAHAAKLLDALPYALRAASWTRARLWCSLRVKFLAFRSGGNGLATAVSQSFRCIPRASHQESRSWGGCVCH